jgi:hypothetical protein
MMDPGGNANGDE